MNAQRGFTLLELLLATSLLLLAIGLTAATVRGFTRGQVATETRIQLAERRDETSSALRERLSAIAPVNFNASDGRQAVFIGESDRMEFVGSIRSHIGAGGLYRQRLQTISGIQGQSLCLQASNLNEPPVSLACQPGPRTTVAEQLANVRFRYRGYDANGKLGIWVDQWSSADVLPEWVEVVITPTDRAQWPPIIVHLPLARHARA